MFHFLSIVYMCVMCMYVHMHVCVVHMPGGVCVGGGFACMWAHVCVEAQGQCQESASIMLLPYSRRPHTPGICVGFGDQN